MAFLWVNVSPTSFPFVLSPHLASFLVFLLHRKRRACLLPLCAALGRCLCVPLAPLPLPLRPARLRLHRAPSLSSVTHDRAEDSGGAEQSRGSGAERARLLTAIEQRTTQREQPAAKQTDDRRHEPAQRTAHWAQQDSAPHESRARTLTFSRLTATVRTLARTPQRQPQPRTRLCSQPSAAMSSSAQLASPLLDGGAHTGAGSDKSGRRLSVDGHGYHAISPVADTSVSVGEKFGEYISRAKARANNTLKICCGLPHRYTMLLCIMFLTFGSYWCYDIPGSIETQLILWFNDGNTDGSYTKASNSLLYSIYSWPNCILAFFGGFLLDKVTGVRRGALLFCGLVALGQLIFSLGCQYKIFWLAFFGRFVFGLGGESLTVAQNTFTVRWFDGKRLALAFGLVVAFSRIGTSVNFVVSPKLANSDDGVPLTVWFGMGMCVLSYISCMCASALDFWGEKKVEDQRQIYMSTLSEEEAIYVRRLDELAEPVGDDISFKMITRIPGTAWLLFLITAVFYVVRGNAHKQSCLAVQPHPASPDLLLTIMRLLSVLSVCLLGHSQLLSSCFRHDAEHRRHDLVGPRGTLHGHSELCRSVRRAAARLRCRGWKHRVCGRVEGD